MTSIQLVGGCVIARSMMKPFCFSRWVRCNIFHTKMIADNRKVANACSVILLSL